MKAPKHILITGASSGIGAFLALEYAAPGILLSLHGRNCERLEKIAEAVKAKGASVSTETGDVTDTNDMALWIATRHQAQPLDLVIANAGISGGTSHGGESDAQARAIFAVNVGGVLNTVQPCLPLMRKRRHGQIAIISSLASFRGLPGAPAYCASKAAVRLYGEGLRNEMSRHHVAINVVCPGFIKTPMTDVNLFPMPFLMKPDAAARKISQGLSRNRARIAFPYPVYAVLRLLTALPQPLIDFISRRTPRK